MIALEKVRAAWVATPHFCQGRWVKLRADRPVAACALAALAIQAGVAPELIARAEQHNDIADTIYPLLRSEYGLTHKQCDQVIPLFDNMGVTEEKGLCVVYAQMERWNEEERAERDRRERETATQVELWGSWAPDVAVEDATEALLQVAGL